MCSTPRSSYRPGHRHHHTQRYANKNCFTAAGADFIAYEQRKLEQKKRLQRRKIERKKDKQAHSEHKINANQNHLQFFLKPVISKIINYFRQLIHYKLA